MVGHSGMRVWQDEEGWDSAGVELRALSIPLIVQNTPGFYQELNTNTISVRCASHNLVSGPCAVSTPGVELLVGMATDLMTQGDALAN